MGKHTNAWATGMSWYGYDDVFGNHESISVSMRPGVDLSGLISDYYFVNDVGVSREEAILVLRFMQPGADKLTATDFIDLDKVEAILKRCKLNDAI